MLRRPPRLTRTYPLVPCPTLFRSRVRAVLLQGRPLLFGQLPVLDALAEDLGRVVVNLVRDQPAFLDRPLQWIVGRRILWTTLEQLVDRKSTRLNSSH